MISNREMLLKLKASSDEGRKLVDKVGYVVYSFGIV